MNLNDIIKVHIWQLPEKTTNINKDSEYTMIHDGSALKKVSMQNLYEYFNQDYKAENLIRYFNETLTLIDEEYQLKYSTLELSLNEYDKLVKQLQEKFRVNRNNINRLESISNQLDKDINDLIIFEDIENDYFILLSNLNDFSTVINAIKNSVSNHTKDIDTLNDNIESLSDTATDIENKHDILAERINTIKQNQEAYLESSKEILIKNINDEYDKILAIIDYYHHIHDSNV